VEGFIEAEVVPHTNKSNARRPPEVRQHLPHELMQLGFVHGLCSQYMLLLGLGLPPASPDVWASGATLRQNTQSYAALASLGGL
jgi:hypothetical protein